MMKNSILKYLFSPFLYFIAYFFMATTTLHHQVDFLLTIHIEFLIFFAIIITTLTTKECLNDKIFWVLTLFSLTMIIIPLISSLANNDYLNILNDGEFGTYLQTLILLPFIYIILKEIHALKIYQTIIFSTFFLSIYFEYRYLILNEIRDYDARPLLKIRHGDANFLCLILSFAIPFGILLIKKYFFDKNKIKVCIFALMTINIFISIFLTQSRMGLIALVLSILYLVIKKEIKMNKSQIVTIFFAIIFSIFYFGQSITNRFENIADKSNSDRLLTYLNSIKIIQDSPFVGVGMHKAKEFFYENTKYPNFQTEFHQLDIHNTFLKTFAEIGFGGFITLLSFIFLIFFNLNNKNIAHKNYLFSGFIILIISSITIGIPYKDFFYIELIILFSLTFNQNLGDIHV